MFESAGPIQNGIATEAKTTGGLTKELDCNGRTDHPKLYVVISCDFVILSCYTASVILLYFAAVISSKMLFASMDADYNRLHIF